MIWKWDWILKPQPRPEGGNVSRILAATIAILFAAFGYLVQNQVRIPPNTLPWEPIDLNASPGWIAHWQLNQLVSQDQRCRIALAKTSQSVVLLKNRKIDDACGFQDVVRIDRTPVTFTPKTTATCALSAGLYWYQGLLQTAAQTQMHTRLVRIDQLGTFACRNVNSEVDGSRSEHATANAIDVAAFHFSDGRVITVAKDYGKNSAEGKFLDAAHDAACTIFNTVLGPRYNQLHENHFHLDMGSYRICR